jgi:hypothetical protein
LWESAARATREEIWMLGSIGEVYPRARKPTPPEHGVAIAYDLSEPEGRYAALLARKGWDRGYSRVEVLDFDHIAIVFLPGAARDLLP